VRRTVVYCGAVNTNMQVNVRSKKEDAVKQSTIEKNNNLRDLHVLEDQLLTRDTQCKQLTAQVQSLQSLLRQRDGKIASFDVLLTQATHKGQLLGRNEASDVEKVLTERLAELSDKYATVSKELRILKEQKLDAAFTRQESDDPIHQEIAVLQAEVCRLKEKHEAAVKLMHEHARAAVMANTRLAHTNHMLRNSNVHRLRADARYRLSRPLVSQTTAGSVWFSTVLCVCVSHCSTRAHGHC
jgi:chromosome segregation ATPase